MNMKRALHCRIDFKGEQVAKTAGLMGIAMFLRIVYFFALTRLEQVGAFLLIFGLTLPVLIEVAYIVMLKVLRFPNAIAYTMMGTGLCLVLFVLSFQYAGILRLILGLFVYLVAGGALMAMILGFVPAKMVKWGLIGLAAGRLIFFNLFQNLFGLHLVTLVFEAAAMVELLALATFTTTLKMKK